MKNLVSVIVPTYSRSSTLEKSIISILSQSYCNVEVVIVDDNGLGTKQQKETSQIVSKYQNNKRVFYYANKYNSGASLSRNVGIEVSNGDYVGFLDDDDTYDKNKIEKQMNLFKEKEELDVCYCGMTYYSKEFKKIGSRKIYVSGSQNILKSHLFRPITGTPTLLIKKPSLLAIKGFDNLKRFQDAGLIFKMLAYNMKFDYVKECLVNVLIHDGPRISTNKTNPILLEKEYIDNCMKYYDLLNTENKSLLKQKSRIIDHFLCTKNISGALKKNYI